ncbi:unnamed protein product [Moneuplotes crassus]|uniref:Uncharacterized protein n=1 Tax=Euplotes crassus TaxID=5936 RepID=A0AAD1XFL8_EUPCR|nr:unnamed protein product [Moneuplotes crassus]
MDSDEGDAFDKLIDQTEEMDVTKINASYFDQKADMKTYQSLDNKLKEISQKLSVQKLNKLKNFSLVRDLVDIIISSQNSFESLKGKQKELKDLEKYLSKICKEILALKNDDFHNCVSGMKPLYLKIKEVNLRLEQVENRKNECERSLKDQSGIDEIRQLEYNALYYSELERGLMLFERYEGKFARVKEYENKNNYIMCILKLQEIDRLYQSNIVELNEFPDLVKIIKSKVEEWNKKIKRELENKVLSILFHRKEDFPSILETTLIVKKTNWVQDSNIEEVEDFFDLVARNVFSLNDSIKLSIAKTLSRKNKEDDIMSMQRIVKRYITIQKEENFDPRDPDYEENQEIIQKIGIFFDDLSDPEIIYVRKEAYLTSCFAALSELNQGNSGGYQEKRSSKILIENVDLEFISQNLLREFPKTLMNAIRLIISKLNYRNKSGGRRRNYGREENIDEDLEFTDDVELQIFNALIGIPLQMLNLTSSFLDSLFHYLLCLFDNFVTIAEITANSQLADEAFNGIQYYIKIILQALFDYDDTLQVQTQDKEKKNFSERMTMGGVHNSPFKNENRSCTFIFSSEEESHEFLKNSIKEQFDFYQTVLSELTDGFIRPNIMYAGFFGWKCNEFLQNLSDKAKKLMNPHSQYKVFVLWNKHFIESSLELLAERLRSKIELLTEGYVSQSFRIFTVAHKEQFEEQSDGRMIQKPNITSSKDLSSRSFESINESVFLYMDTLSRFLKFLGSPVKSNLLFKTSRSAEENYTDYTTNLHQTLVDNISMFSRKLESFFNELVKNTHFPGSNKLEKEFFSKDFYEGEINSVEFIKTVEKTISVAASTSIDVIEEEKLSREGSIASGKDIVYDEYWNSKQNKNEMSFLQLEGLESITGGGSSEEYLEFLKHPRLAIEDNYLKSDITLITLMIELSWNLGELIKGLKTFEKATSHKLSLQKTLKPIITIYNNCNIFLRCEIVGRIFCGLREMVYTDFNKKYGSKGAESFGNFVCREIKYFYHLTQQLGLRGSYIMSVVPRLVAKIFRTNIRYIKNSTINENGFNSLETTFEYIIASFKIFSKNDLKSISALNQCEVSKTKYFIHLLSLQKKELITEITENEQNCTMMEYNSILNIQTHRRDKLNDLEKKSLLKMVKERTND